MRVLVPLPVVLPLAGAALSLMFHGRVTAQRILGAVVLTATAGCSVLLLIEVEQAGMGVSRLGGWPAPIGITMAADEFSAIMLVVSSVMVLAVFAYAVGSPATSDQAAFFHPVYLILAAGVAMSFLTGDLFNLFVAFEVMLTASYVLITLGANREQVRAGMTYVVISLLASTLFITAVALVYAATGTVNMADLAGKMDQIPNELRHAFGLVLLVVFGVKAAIFPLFFWLPDSYPTAPTPVTAIFAGLLTKVGVYAIIRTHTLLFAPADGPSAVLLGLAAATMVVGVLGAIAQDDMKRILSFHIVSQIGYMVMGLGFFTVAGVAACVFYIVHHIVVKTSLFLVTGLVEQSSGTAALRRLSGLARRFPIMGVLFLIPALSLAGIPPLSGFPAKLALVQAGLAIDSFAVVGASLLVSLLTLFSMAKIWGGAFWGRPDDTDEAAGHRIPRLMLGATGAVVALTLIIAAGAATLYDLSWDAAEALVDPARYVEGVLGP